MVAPATRPALVRSLRTGEPAGHPRAGGRPSAVERCQGPLPHPAVPTRPTPGSGDLGRRPALRSRRWLEGAEGVVL